jgi:hypothetical protein
MAVMKSPAMEMQTMEMGEEKMDGRQCGRSCAEARPLIEAGVPSGVHLGRKRPCVTGPGEVLR